MNILIKILDYISTIGLNDLEKASNVEVWSLNKYNEYNLLEKASNVEVWSLNKYNEYNLFPAEFNLWLNNDSFAVRYFFYKGAYYKSEINCKRKEYPEIITQSEIRPYLIKEIENSK